MTISAEKLKNQQQLVGCLFAVVAVVVAVAAVAVVAIVAVVVGNGHFLQKQFKNLTCPRLRFY